MIRRIAATFAALALLAAGAVNAQQYPTKPVKIIVPFPAGQATDLAARVIAEALGKEWNQSVVVENVGGGAGIPGMVTGKNAPADGYTLIGPVFRNPLIIVATEKSPYKTLKDVVDAAKKDPGKLNWGYPGAGTTQHLTGELFKQVAGVNIQGVMYKGSAATVQDLLGDSIQLSVDGIGPNLPHIKSGKLRALASTGETRSSQLPDVPTVAEQGYPGFSGEGWGGVVVPKGVPNDLVLKISRDLNKIMSDPAVQDRLLKAGLAIDNMPRDQWIAFFKQTHTTWGDVARRNSIRIQ